MALFCHRLNEQTMLVPLVMGPGSSVSTCFAPACFFHFSTLMQNPLLLSPLFHPYVSASSSPLAVIYGLILCASWSLSLVSPLLSSHQLEQLSHQWGQTIQPPNLKALQQGHNFVQGVSPASQTTHHFSRNIYYLRAHEWSLSSFQFSSHFLHHRPLLLTGTKPLLNITMKYVHL